MKVFNIDMNGEKLISDNGKGIINIEPGPGYKIKERSFEKDVVPYFSDYYRALGIIPRNPVYSGAEHPHLPNITVLPNLETKNGKKVFGCTMGHEQRTVVLPVQEIYEFYGYGAMILKTNGEIIFYYAKPGDKVLVPGSSNSLLDMENTMTLYNLDNQPLITADISNPVINTSKKYMQRRRGPVLCAYYDEDDAVFCFNKSCLKNTDSVDEIKIPLTGASLSKDPASVGEEIYDRLETDVQLRKKFQTLGVKPVPANKTIRLLKRGIGYFESEADAIELLQNDYIRKYFLMDTEESTKKLVSRTLENIRNIDPYMKSRDKYDELMLLVEMSDDITEFLERVLNEELGDSYLRGVYLSFAHDCIFRAKLDDALAERIIDEKLGTLG